MAASSHKRDTNARRKPKAVTVAGSVAVLATAVAVVAGLALTNPTNGSLVAQDAHQAIDDHAATPSAASTPAPPARPRTVSRDQSRLSLGGAKDLVGNDASATAASATSTKMWTTDTLNLWTAAGNAATQVGDLDAGKQVLFTGRTLHGRDEIVVNGQTRWVTHGYLSKTKPAAGPTAVAGLSDAPCPDSSVEKGLAADTIVVYRAVCHAFPQVKDYIGWGPREEHDTGHAIDVMVYDDKALGDAIAAWAQAHASELNLYDVIWYDRIWTPVRASEGWRDYGDHGSPTANHMDHVHIGTN